MLVNWKKGGPGFHLLLEMIKKKVNLLNINEVLDTLTFNINSHLVFQESCKVCVIPILLTNTESQID